MDKTGSPAEKLNIEETPSLPANSFSPLPFKNFELCEKIKNAKKIHQKALNNMLNHIHFTGGYIHVHLRHPIFLENMLFKASPRPYSGGEFTCTWAEGYPRDIELQKYTFENLFIDASLFMIHIPGELREINENGCTLKLSNTGYVVGHRQVKRYNCSEIKVEFIQNGFIAKGVLLDFSPIGIRVSVTPEPSFSFHGFDPGEKVNLQIKNESHLLFIGTGKCIRHQIGANSGEFAIIPSGTVISRFKKRQFRNQRHKLNPIPTLSFMHPIINKTVQLEVLDISTSGFSALEDTELGVLLPGMIIPELHINFAGAHKLKCMAQVIYRETVDGKDVRCGISILDMDMTTYSHFSDILISAEENHTHVSGDVNSEELWEFFFSTGFLYPQKYGMIQAHREEFKKTYLKLYNESPEIAKHVVYQKRGRILGHISMVRVYEKTWMIHHHAARSGEMTKAGIKVLTQLVNVLNDLYRLPSAKMDYLVCFFRPNSRFPRLIFGDFAKLLGDKRGCSMDLFSYFSIPTTSIDHKLPEPWELGKSSIADFLEFDQFYRHNSDGLFQKAMGIDARKELDRTLEKEYARFGFFRKLDIFSLKHREEVHAILILNHSDLGLNLSELTNCIQVIVTNPSGPPWEVLSKAIRVLAVQYKNMHNVPALIYPEEYINSKGLKYERQYYCWIFNVRYGENFIEYVQEKFNMKSK